MHWARVESLWQNAVPRRDHVRVHIRGVREKAAGRSGKRIADIESKVHEGVPGTPQRVVSGDDQSAQNLGPGCRNADVDYAGAAERGTRLRQSLRPRNWRQKIE